jgi:hypothetical protein
MLLKGTMNQKDTTSVNVQAPNFGVPNFLKILPNINDQMGKDKIIMGKFSSPLSSIDRSFRTKRNQQRNSRVKLYTINQRNLADIFRIFPSNILKICILFRIL